MKVRFTISTAFFEVLANLEIKQPKQKKRRPTRHKPKSDISQTIINIIANK